MKKKMPKTFQGKSTKPGGGGQFAMAMSAMTKKGMSKQEASAIAANEGRKKYGVKKMAQFSTAGRKRANKKGKLS